MIDPFPWQALGAALADARHRSDHTQHHLARHLGITQAAYSQIERGLIRPRPALLLPLAVLLGIGVGQLAALAGYPLEQITFTDRSKRATRIRH
jgi:transcriptional regulator with XRE-family HTH domain